MGKDNFSLNKHIILLTLTAFLVFSLFVFFQIDSITNTCSGKFIYPIDDAYIHLSISKNIAEKGIWGVTEHEFSSSSSSLLYPLILSFLIKIFGNIIYLPIFINLAAVLLLCYALFKILSPVFIRFNAYKNSYWKETILLFTVVILILFLIPALMLALIGMEHTLQIAVNILFIFYLSEFIIKKKQKTQIYLTVLAFFVTAIRYEGLFIIAIAFAILIYAKEYKTAFFILLSAILPITIYGIISMLNGWSFLPNSIIVKSTKPKGFSLESMFYYPFQWLKKLISEKHLLSLFITSLAFLIVNIRFKRKIYEAKNLWILFTLVLIILQLTSARTGWAYRYEAYIIAIGIIGLIINLFDIFKFGTNELKTASVILTFILFSLCISRAVDSVWNAPVMSRNVYEQPYSTAQFLKEYYNNSTVVLNDIGACTYFTNIKLVDFVALGSKETLDLKIQNNVNSESLGRLSQDKNVEIAVLYDEVWDDYIPQNWRRAAELQIENNIICYRDKIIFYAVGDIELLKLKYHLMLFKNKIPQTVKFKIYD